MQETFTDLLTRCDSVHHMFRQKQMHVKKYLFCFLLVLFLITHTQTHNLLFFQHHLHLIHTEPRCIQKDIKQTCGQSEAVCEVNTDELQEDTQRATVRSISCFYFVLFDCSKWLHWFTQRWLCLYKYATWKKIFCMYFIDIQLYLDKLSKAV